MTINDVIREFLQTLDPDQLVAFVRLSKAAQRTQFQTFVDAKITALNAGLADLDAARARAQTTLTASRDEYTAIRSQL